MRRVYKYMSNEEKGRALELLSDDIRELEKELQRDYPSLVKEAIIESLDRYRTEESWLINEVEDN